MKNTTENPLPSELLPIGHAYKDYDQAIDLANNELGYDIRAGSITERYLSASSDRFFLLLPNIDSDLPDAILIKNEPPVTGSIRMLLVGGQMISTGQLSSSGLAEYFLTKTYERYISSRGPVSDFDQISLDEERILGRILRPIRSATIPEDQLSINDMEIILDVAKQSVTTARARELIANTEGDLAYFKDEFERLYAESEIRHAEIIKRCLSGLVDAIVNACGSRVLPGYTSSLTHDGRMRVFLPREKRLLVAPPYRNFLWGIIKIEDPDIDKALEAPASEWRDTRKNAIELIWSLPISEDLKYEITRY